jgi:hypothetical protein
MMAKDEKTGIVYVLTNPLMLGLVKIGKTESSEMDALIE